LHRSDRHLEKRVKHAGVKQGGSSARRDIVNVADGATDMQQQTAVRGARA
jgi:hypothetical protein